MKIKRKDEKSSGKKEQKLILNWIWNFIFVFMFAKGINLSLIFKVNIIAKLIQFGCEGKGKFQVLSENFFYSFKIFVKKAKISAR